MSFTWEKCNHNSLDSLVLKIWAVSSLHFSVLFPLKELVKQLLVFITCVFSLRTSIGAPLVAMETGLHPSLGGGLIIWIKLVLTPRISSVIHYYIKIVNKFQFKQDNTVVASKNLDESNAARANTALKGSTKPRGTIRANNILHVVYIYIRV